MRDASCCSCRCDLQVFCWMRKSWSGASATKVFGGTLRPCKEEIATSQKLRKGPSNRSLDLVSVKIQSIALCLGGYILAPPFFLTGETGFFCSEAQRSNRSSGSPMEVSVTRRLFFLCSISNDLPRDHSRLSTLCPRKRQRI
jgi:hypothetical protein